MSDDAIRLLERELARQGISPEEWAAKILGTDLDRWAVLTEEPLRGWSEPFRERLDAYIVVRALRWKWQTPARTIDEAMTLATNVPHAGLYDKKAKEAGMLVAEAAFFEGSTTPRPRFWAAPDPEPLYDTIALPSASMGRLPEPERFETIRIDAVPPDAAPRARAEPIYDRIILPSGADPDRFFGPNGLRPIDERAQRRNRRRP